MKLPRLVWPTAVASVAVPITQTAAVRTPAIRLGSASGASTRNRRWRCVMPTPRAASITSGSTPKRPVTAPRRIGSTEYSVSANSAGRKPSAEKRAPMRLSAAPESASSSG